MGRGFSSLEQLPTEWKCKLMHMNHQLLLAPGTVGGSAPKLRFDSLFAQSADEWP